MRDLFSVCLMVLLCSTLSYAQNREADSLALVDLYCATNGLFWTNTWDLNTLGTPPPMDEWFGVRMSDTLIGGEYRVVCLDLDGDDSCHQWNTPYEGNNLSGILPDLNLTELKNLYLSNNKLIGPIPDFSNMPKLEKLYLNGNQLSDSIPNFTNLNNLIELGLSNNRLAGNVIDFDNLPNLERLYLSANRLSDTIPDFAKLPKLRVLRLGEYAEHSGKSNHLTGSIPNFSNLKDLEELNISYNGLTDTIPDFTDLQKLRKLDIRHNGLSGNIPDFAHLDSLRDLNLSHNGLIGAIPNFSRLDFLTELWLNDNSLTGEIPNFTDLQNLTRLDIQKNSLTGQIPEFTYLTALTHLYINDNSLTGEIPNFVTANLLELNLQNNSFTQATLSLSSLTNVINLNLSNCNLSGIINNLGSLGGLQNFDVSNNNLTGNIPNFSGSVKRINMSNNCLNGPVQNIAGLSNLEVLYLNNNDLDGGLSKETFDELVSLWYLDISNNKLTGEIPTFELTVPQSTPPNPSATSNLQELRLSNNGLYGDIEHGFVELTLLRELHLDNNNLSGNIPEFDLKKLEELDLSYNNLVGTIPTFVNTFSLVALADSMNLDAISSIRQLYLNNNNLTGSIPTELLDLSQLWDINLTYNSLDGPYDAGFDSSFFCENFNNQNISNGNNFDESWDCFCDDNNCMGTSNAGCMGNLPPIPNNASCAERDAIILERIYCQNNGPNWVNPWNISEPISQWAGVTLNSNDCVIELNLSGRNLTGDLSEFSELTNLMVLNLSNNNLIGKIDNISNLQELTSLRLNNNRLEGDIPTWNTPDLEYINLSQNDLIGSVPSFQQSPNLVEVQLGINNLTGTIPAFDNLTKLKHLNLDYNQLKGQIPNFDSLYNLQHLHLDHNNLTDTIPNFPNMPELRELHLQENQLSGQIPDFGSLGSLEKLYINNNHLTGTIPNFPNLDNLEIFNASHNHLTGNIPDFGSLANLEGLNLSYNNLTDTIPDFSNSLLMSHLELQNNNLTGTLPNFNNLQNLLYLDASNNNLMGGIPNFDLSALEKLYLNNNDLTATIPNFSVLPSLRELKLNHNILSGQIPNFNQLNSLKILFLQHNILSGNIPNFNLPALTQLDLNDNILTGPIPNFNQLDTLYGLSLNDNILTGEIPPAFAALNNLRYLSLQNNQLDSCYAPVLSGLCEQLNDDSNNNGNISDGNAFTIPWQTFCGGTSAICDTFDLRITLDTTNITACNPTNGSISLQVNFGSPPYQFEWSGDTLMTPDLIDLPEGKYYVTVSDCKGGMVIDSVELKTPAPPRIDSIDITNAYCGEAVGSLSPYASGGMPPYQYSLDSMTWQTDPFFPNLPGDSTYTIFILDDIGCAADTSATIDYVELLRIDSVEIVDAKCELPNGSITVFASNGPTPYEYRLDSMNWQPENVFDNLSAGDYTIYATDAIGCIVDTIITIDDTPKVTFTTYHEDPSCGIDNGLITISPTSGTEPFTYICNNDTLPQPICDNLSGDEYLITVIDNEGCQADATITLAISDSLQIDLNVVTTPCVGEQNCGTVQLSLSGWNNPYVVGWTPIGNGIFEGCVPVGTSTYTISDDDECEYEYSISFPEFEYKASVTPASVTMVGGEQITFSVSGTMQAEWLPEENLNYLSCSDCLEPIFTAPVPLEADMNGNCQRVIDYQVVAYNDAENCTDTLSVSITVENKIYVPEGFTPNNDGINDELLIPALGSIAGTHKLAIFNRWGELVYEFKGDESTSYSSNPWLGTYYKNGVDTGQKLPDATYYYSLEYGTACYNIQKGSIFIR